MLGRAAPESGHTAYRLNTGSRPVREAGNIPPAATPQEREVLMADLNPGLLETSFVAVTPRAPELAQRFDDTLFERYPSVIPLFDNTTQEVQESKLIASLAMIADSLRKPVVLQDYLHTLGANHADGGAVPGHDDAVGEVLLESLASVAGDLWTPELQTAWADAYGAISGLMLQGADAAQDAP